MLVIKIELWPGGDEGRAELLTTARIVNIMTHSERPNRGNYVVRLNGQGPNKTALWRTGQVDNFPRLSQGPWELLRRALNATLDKGD